MKMDREKNILASFEFMGETVRFWDISMITENTADGEEEEVRSGSETFPCVCL